MGTSDPMPVSTEPGVVVTLRENGPIIITGPVTVNSGAEPSVESRLFLCRCGQSAIKPTCDGTHKTCGFKAPGQPVTLR